MKFQQFLNEAGAKGFQYEKEIYNNLKKQGLVPKGFSPAGSAAFLPDGMFMYQGQPYNLEIKLDMKADFGQIELRKEGPKWEFGGKNETLKDFYNGLNLLNFVNKEWTGIPKRFTISPGDYTQADVDFDYSNFKNKYIPVPVNGLYNHYAKKNTYYIQVGGYGLYHMEKDVAGLGTPKFDAKLRARLRIKRRSSKKLSKYGFLVALQIAKPPKKSHLDLDKDLSFLKK